MKLNIISVVKIITDVLPGIVDVSDKKLESKFILKNIFSSIPYSKKIKQSQYTLDLEKSLLFGM